MRCIKQAAIRLVPAIVLLSAASTAGRAQEPAEVRMSDTASQPENLTSTADGTLYFGSMASGTIYRAAPRAAQAEPWILADRIGLSRTLGVLADEASNTLWVCQNSTGGRDGAPVEGQTALRSFELTTGAPRATYDLPSNGGVCNDMTVAADGSVYVTESFANRVHLLRPGTAGLEIWIADSLLDAVDGIALLADGAVYVNTFSSGRLFRIPVHADGSAGPLTPIETSLPLIRPDGLRATGPMTLVQAEQGGRLAELTVSGNRAELRVIRDGLTRPSGVTIVGPTAFVLVEFARAVAVPYP